MPKKILLIEDEKDLVELLEFRLKASGYEIESALDGPIGIKKAKTVKPDLIILDLAMPGMSGFQVSDQLKADTSTKDIPIIVLTAVKISSLSEKIDKIGAADCISKPFEPRDLLASIKKALG